jgi:hypothetical protein
MPNIAEQDITELLKKLQGNTAISVEDLQKMNELFKCLALTVRVQDEQIRYFESLVAVLRDGNAAAEAATTAATNALKGVAPPTASIDTDAVRKETAKLREDIKNSVQISQTLASVARFAVNVVGKFV